MTSVLRSVSGGERFTTHGIHRLSERPLSLTLRVSEVHR